MRVDLNYKQFATERQWEYYVAYCELESGRRVGDKLGVSGASVSKSLRAMYRAAAKKGYAPDYGHERVVPEGLALKGTSTLYDEAGNVKMQWVKTEQELEDIEDQIRDACEVLTAGINGLSHPREYTNRNGRENLLSVYPITDLHVGLLSWWHECGESQDLNIIDSVVRNSIMNVIYGQPVSKKCIIPFMGDYFHSDTDDKETSRSGNKLDVDGRTDKIFGRGIQLAQFIIEQAADKHEEVEVIVIPGNHDDYLSMAMRHVLMSYYSNDERITIQDTHGVFGYHEFGNTLLAFHHGHSCKPGKLYEAITSDQAQAWGRVKMCHVLTGHVHHQSVIDVGRMKIESFRAPCAKDAYATEAGYRATRSMYGITYNRFQGEIGRTQYNILDQDGDPEQNA